MLPLLPYIEYPTKSGSYWFRNESAFQELMIEVFVVDGILTASWLGENVSVTRLKGRCRGPLIPSYGPGSHQQIGFPNMSESI